MYSFVRLFVHSFMQSVRQAVRSVMRSVSQSSVNQLIHWFIRYLSLNQLIYNWLLDHWTAILFFFSLFFRFISYNSIYPGDLLRMPRSWKLGERHWFDGPRFHVTVAIAAQLDRRHILEAVTMCQVSSSRQSTKMWTRTYSRLEKYNVANVMFHLLQQEAFRLCVFLLSA